MNLKFIFIYLFSLCLYLESTAQALRKPALDGKIQNARKAYFHAKGNNLGLYVGHQYNDLSLHHYDVGHPFFLTDDWIAGSIKYDGIWYQDADLMYELVHDQVIVQSRYNFQKVELLKDRIEAFSLSGHYFENIPERALIEPGIYEVLHDDGKIKALVKWKKNMSSKIDSKLIITSFSEANRYFVFKAGNYHMVRSKTSLVDVFADRKDEVRKILTRSHLKFRKNKREAILAVVQSMTDAKDDE